MTSKQLDTVYKLCKEDGFRIEQNDPGCPTYLIRDVDNTGCYVDKVGHIVWYSLL